MESREPEVLFGSPLLALRSSLFNMIQVGLEVSVCHPPPELSAGRFGLLMNQASVDRDFRYACDVLTARFPGQLAAIFSPQHGLWGEQQANMIESPHGWYDPVGVPVYSLYSKTRRPTGDMLRGLQGFVIDLQDIGTRVYTFIWTVSHCLEACAEAGIPVVILDRPNPLGGETVEGAPLESGFESFVGRARIPMRHGLTLAELALLVNRELQIGARITSVPMDGWRRSMLWQDTRRTWVPPSPNMPRMETALLYPGQVLLEGTNLSEGRGTTTPFELVGAPFIDPFLLVRELQRHDHPGLHLRPERFVPTFDKWMGQSCGGVAFHVVDPPAVRSFRTTLAVLTAVRKLWPRDMTWLPPPYEYEHEKMPIDILFGSSLLREKLDENVEVAPSDLDTFANVDTSAWRHRTAEILLYE